VSVRVLALTTSTNQQGVCLRVPGREDAVIASAYKRGQPRELTRSIWRLLGEAELVPADLDLLVCDLGPGSFTGLRLGLATVRALAWAHGIQAAGVGSLEALLFEARQSQPQISALAVLPSRRGVVYAGVVPNRAISGEAGFSTAEIPLNGLADWLQTRGLDLEDTAPTLVGPALVLGSVAQALGRTMSTLSIEGPDPQIVLQLGVQASKGGAVGGGLKLQPRYLALSQAERNIRPAN